MEWKVMECMERELLAGCQSGLIEVKVKARAAIPLQSPTPDTNGREPGAAQSLERRQVGKNIANVLATETEVGHRRMGVGDKGSQDISMVGKPPRYVRERWYVGEHRTVLVRRHQMARRAPCLGKQSSVFGIAGGRGKTTTLTQDDRQERDNTECRPHAISPVFALQAYMKQPGQDNNLLTALHQ